MNAITERAETAMQRCLFKAERVNSGWTEQAHALLRRYLSCWETMEFLTEDFAGWAELHGLPVPHDKRAMGGIMKSAARSGTIIRAGYREDKWASIKTVWRKSV